MVASIVELTDADEQERRFVEANRRREAVGKPPLPVDRRLLEALREGDGSRKFAAERLGISARTLRYKLARLREAGVAIPG